MDTWRMAFNLRTGSFNNQVMSPLNVHVRGLRQRDQVTSRPGQFVTRLRPRASGAAGPAGCPVDFPAARYAFVRSNLA